MNEIERMLEELHETANAPTEYRFWMVGKQLVQQLAVFDILDLAVYELTDYLHIFETYYPNISWPREFLTQFHEVERSKWRYKYRFYAGLRYDSFNSCYFNALGLLSDGAKAAGKPKFAYDLLWSSIEWSVGVRNTESWVRTHPEDWYIEIDADDNFTSEIERIASEVPQAVREHMRFLRLHLAEAIDDMLRGKL